jgi:outer membrane lipoprotein-sorting protein
MRKIILAILCISPLLCSATDEALTGRDIAERMQAVDNSYTSQRNGTMVIQRRGQTLRRSLTRYHQQTEDGQRNLIIFTEPADIRNTKYLSWIYESPEKNDDLWIFLPSENLTRRISGSGGKKGSFMRSDFSNEDISKSYPEDNKQRLLGSEILFDQDTYFIESIPLNKKDSNYSKREIWVNKETWLPVQIYFYDKSGQHFKTAIYGGAEKIDGIWTITKIKMITPRRQSTTLLQYKDIAYNIELDKSLFTQSALKR